MTNKLLKIWQESMSKNVLYCLIGRKSRQRTFPLIVSIILGSLMVLYLTKETRLTRQILPRDHEFLFVGGVPRSGTTLMRVLLDVHPEIRCGEETGLIISILEVVTSYLNAPNWNENANFSAIKHNFVKPVLEDVNAGITREVLMESASAFIAELIRKHAPEETVLCNKDPVSLVYMSLLHEMFPKAKFIVMVRDARGTLHSLITKYHKYRWNFILDNTRNLTLSELEHNFKVWNYLIGIMIKQCVNIGPELCMIVHYERLVQSTPEELERIMNFIGVTLAEQQLEHEKHLENVQLDWFQIRLDQVINKVYTKGTNIWLDFYPPELMSNLSEIAPMLEVLGYDTKSQIPSYKNLPLL